MYRRSKIINPPVPLRIAWHFAKKAIAHKFPTEQETKIDAEFTWSTHTYL